MRYLLCFFVLLSLVHPALAATFTTTIHSIDLGKDKKEFHIVKFDNGRVGFVEFDNDDLIRALDVGRKANLNINVVLDERFYVLSAQTIGPAEETEGELCLNPYKPSVLKDYNSALNILNRMRRDYTEEGQCFNRAHVWAYEEYMRSGLRSMKLFMFFTNRYIRNYNFHWWFHVTPMTYVGSTPRTLDRRYAKGPAQIKAWTDIFIKSKRTCPKITTFARYAEGQEREDCYLIPVSMYFVIPRDVERRDLSGIEKTEFLQKDLDRAYRDAFNE